MQTITQILNMKPMEKGSKISTSLFFCFKKRGIPGGLVKVYYESYGIEYLVRKYWYLEYKMEQGVVKSPVGWLRNNIENEFSETDGFWDWYRRKKQVVLDGDYDEKIKTMAAYL